MISQVGLAFTGQFVWKDTAGSKKIRLNSVTAGDGILKKWNLWRRKCEHHKQYTNQADCGEGEPWMPAWQRVLFESPPFEEKGKQCGNIENGDIHPIRRLAKSAIVSVKQHRNQYQPQQNMHQLDAPEILPVFEKQPLYQGEEKQWPEQQFHMLPSRFIDAGKGRNKDTSARPVVEKV